jgi:hypothetical protein
MGKTLTALVVAFMFGAAITARAADRVTFEDVAIVPRLIGNEQYVAVAYVMRNNTREAFEHVSVSCAVYSSGKLIDVAGDTVNNLAPLAKANGRTMLVPMKVVPDRAECTAQPL